MTAPAATAAPMTAPMTADKRPPPMASYVTVGKRRIRVPRSRGLRVALAVLFVLRGMVPSPASLILLPGAVLLLSVDFPRFRRWRRRATVWMVSRHRRRSALRKMKNR